MQIHTKQAFKKLKRTDTPSLFQSYKSFNAPYTEDKKVNSGPTLYHVTNVLII